MAPAGALGSPSITSTFTDLEESDWWYDCSLSKYVDDLAKLLAIPDSKALTLQDELRHNDEDANLAFGWAGFSQNSDKTESGLRFQGAGSNGQTMLLNSGTISICGTINHHARFLGGLVSTSFSAAPELQRRLVAMRSGYAQLVSFWKSRAI